MSHNQNGAQAEPERQVESEVDRWRREYSRRGVHVHNIIESMWKDYDVSVIAREVDFSIEYVEKVHRSHLARECRACKQKKD